MTHETLRSDRRIHRTRRQLRDALMALILERGFNSITIEDITERADLGRTTFYLHYKDKEELLLESLESIAEDLRVQVEALVEENLVQGRVRLNPVAVAFRHADENRDLYRIILQAEGTSRAYRHLRDVIYNAALNFFTKHMKEEQAGRLNISAGMISGYFSSALLGFITWWLERDLPYTGDEAADLFVQLFFGGSMQVIELPSELG
jgi:AcrR family transcriptional regulator